MKEDDQRWVVVICSFDGQQITITNVCLLATSKDDALKQVREGWDEKIVAAYAITAEEYAAEAIRFRDETDQPWRRVSFN